MITHVHLVVLHSPNAERAKTFYELLGFVFSLEQHGRGPKHYAAEGGGLVFEIYPAPTVAVDRIGLPAIGFEFDNLDEVIERLRQAGILFNSLHEQGYCAIVKDPDGRRVELTKPQEELAITTQSLL